MDEMTSGDKQWEACPAGELRRLVGGLKARRRDKSVARFVSVTGACLIIVLASGLIVQQLRVNITCSEVNSHLPAFIAKNLDAELADRVRTHLAKCSDCALRYQKMKSQMSVSSHQHRERLSEHGYEHAPCNDSDKRIARYGAACPCLLITSESNDGVAVSRLSATPQTFSNKDDFDHGRKFQAAF
jgi:hypothetical protein